MEWFSKVERKFQFKLCILFIVVGMLCFQLFTLVLNITHGRATILAFIISAIVIAKLYASYYPVALIVRMFSEEDLERSFLKAHEWLVKKKDFRVIETGIGHRMILLRRKIFKSKSMNYRARDVLLSEIDIPGGRGVLVACPSGISNELSAVLHSSKL